MAEIIETISKDSTSKISDELTSGKIKTTTFKNPNDLKAFERPINKSNRLTHKHGVSIAQPSCIVYIRYLMLSIG